MLEPMNTFFYVIVQLCNYKQMSHLSGGSFVLVENVLKQVS